MRSVSAARCPLEICANLRNLWLSESSQFSVVSSQQEIRVHPCESVSERPLSSRKSAGKMPATRKGETPSPRRRSHPVFRLLSAKRVPGSQGFGGASPTLRVPISASPRLCASSLLAAAAGRVGSFCVSCGEEVSLGRPPAVLCPLSSVLRPLSPVCSVPSVSSVAEDQFPVDSSQFPVAACGLRLPRCARNDMLRK